MEKIQRYSQVFKVLCLFALFAMPILTLLFWLSPSSVIKLIGLNVSSILFNINFLPGSMSYQNFELSTRLYALLISFIPVGFNMAIAYALAKLFACYEKGQIFDQINAIYIKIIGYILLLQSIIVPSLYQALITLDLSWHNPVGQRYFSASLYVSNIVIAIIVIMISRVMSEAAKLKTEQDLTV